MIAATQHSIKSLWALALCAIIIALLLGCSKNIENRKALYPNGQVKEEWTVMLDKNGNYIEQGKYVAWYENGQKKQEELWENGMLQGRFITWHDNGLKHQQGQYLNGKMNGKYAEWDPAGNKAIEGSMKEGKQDGKWTYYDEKGNIFKQEDYVDGQLK